MENKKEKDALKDGLLDRVSGGCGVVRAIVGSPTCSCTGERVKMEQVGTDETGRIVTYRCSNCGATTIVYE